MKISWFFQLMFQIKNLKILCIRCFKLMMINHIMCTSNILTDLGFANQEIKTKKEWFYRTCLQCFSRESVLIKHK